MLNGIFSPEQIDFLVQNGVIDVIKRCSINGCKDIAHEAGPYALVYAAGFGLSVAVGTMTISYLRDKHKQNQQLPVQEENLEIPAEKTHRLSDFLEAISPTNILNSFSGSESGPKP